MYANILICWCGSRIGNYDLKTIAWLIEQLTSISINEVLF